MANVKAIVAKLTDAQRRALLTGSASGTGKWPLRYALASKGLAESMPFRLTPLGLEVRDELERSK